MFVRKKNLAALAAAMALCLALCFGLSAVSAAKASPAFRPVVVLDAGHGGIDPGVIGTDTGAKESDINLGIVKILEELFADAGFRVVLTRTNGGGLYGLPVGGHKKRDMQARRARIEAARPDVVLSIHQNTFPADRSRRGGQAFYRVGRRVRGARFGDPEGTERPVGRRLRRARRRLLYAQLHAVHLRHRRVRFPL